MNFEYLKTETYMDSIDIEDTGNCVININNDDAQEWFMKIDTYLGWTSVTTFGPMVIDSDTMPTFYSYNHFEMEFNEKKIYKTIRDFINNPRNNITQVFEGDIDLYEERLKVLISCLQNQ